MSEKQCNRRIFLMGAAATTLVGCATTRQPSLSRAGYKSPNEKLNVAGIGCGGKGGSDIQGCKSENIVALCDADWRRGAGSFREFPNANKYKDFRVMLDKEKSIDAVTVSTPDHIHAVAAMAAIKRGIHVYCQKPLTHSVYEARMLAEAAEEYGVATQMGNQGHSGEGVRQLCEIIWSGAIGDVHEIHSWTNRPIWPQGISEPLPEEEIPEEIDWDLWLGPAPYRPFNSGYAPFNWRGWWDFGTGSLGDMACHILDPPNWSMHLSTVAPTSIECISQEKRNTQTYPTKAILKFEFPKRGKMPPLTLYWYDGGIMPPRPEGVPEDEPLGDSDGRNGSIFIGDNGIATTGTYGGGTRLLPKSAMDDFVMPDKTIPRSIGHYEEWIQACKGGAPSPGNFSYAGPMTEWILLGNLALYVNGKVTWDSKSMTYSTDATISPPYREGWSL